MSTSSPEICWPLRSTNRAPTWAIAVTPSATTRATEPIAVRNLHMSSCSFVASICKEPAKAGQALNWLMSRVLSGPDVPDRVYLERTEWPV
jgi:hypothetical protein